MPMSSHHERTTLRASAAVTVARDCLLLLWLMFAMCAASSASALNTGDILVTSHGGGGGEASLAYVSRATGEQHVLVPFMGHFNDVVSLVSGDIFVLAEGALILKIDATSGASSTVSALGLLRFSGSLDLAPDGNLYVVDGANGALP